MVFMKGKEFFRALIDDGQERFADKISSLVMVAPAINFIRPYYRHNYNNMEKQHQEKLDQGEVKIGTFTYFVSDTGSF